MATNIIYEPAWHQSLVCSDPATPASGDPVRFGAFTGIALTDERTDGTTSVDLGQTVATFSVKGVDGGGNSAVGVGDALFYVDADTPKLSKKATGYLFGIAMEAVNSAATATIKVMHVPSPGAGTLGSGTVSATNLASSAVETAKIAANAVTAAKLTATMATGFIPLPLTIAREITSNDLPAVGTPDGGLLSLDTTPTLKRANAATDKKLRLGWAASNSDAITWDFTYPTDLDDTANVEVHILAAMAGAIDTPTIAINYFEGLGDSNAGGATAAITGTSIAEYSRVITAANIGAAPNGASVELVPGAHTTDALYVYAAWIEYTRV